MALSRWLDEHLETFVRPYLGEIPSVDPSLGRVQEWTPEFLKKLQVVWAAAKVRSKGRPILLPGRDVFLVEVLARMEEFPTTYRREISSSVTYYGRHLLEEDFSPYYALDTGFSGSVPRALKVGAWDLVRHNSSPEEKLKHQVIPTDDAGALPNYMESAPKYWTRALVTPSRDVSMAPVTGFHQDPSPKEEFRVAAMLTQLVARTVEPPKSYFAISDGRYL